MTAAVEVGAAAGTAGVEVGAGATESGRGDSGCVKSEIVAAELAGCRLKPSGAIGAELLQPTSRSATTDNAKIETRVIQASSRRFSIGSASAS